MLLSFFQGKKGSRNYGPLTMSISAHPWRRSPTCLTLIHQILHFILYEVNYIKVPILSDQYFFLFGCLFRKLYDGLKWELHQVLLYCKSTGTGLTLPRARPVNIYSRGRKADRKLNDRVAIVGFLTPYLARFKIIKSTFCNKSVRV